MLFCLTLCDDDRRVILDDEPHGEVLAIIDTRDWIEARRQVWQLEAMDPYGYKPGHGWINKSGLK